MTAFKLGMLTTALTVGVLLSAVGQSQESTNVTLTKSNTVVIRGEIEGTMLSKKMVEISALKTKDVVLFLQSPGGSVISGVQFIQFMKDSGKKFTCIADTAASMAFVILQACNNRYVLSSSQIMQHQASFGIEGPMVNLKAQYDHISSIIEDLEKMQAKRIGIPLAQFQKDRLNDLWLYADQAVKYGAADKVVSAKCDSSLWKGTTVENVQVMTFTLKVTYNNCPLARAPLSIEMATGMSQHEQASSLKNIMGMWDNLKETVEKMKSRMFK